MQGLNRSKMPLTFAFALLLILPSLVSTQPVKPLNNKFVPLLPKGVSEVFDSENDIISPEEASGIFSGDCEDQVDIPIVVMAGGQY
ncbi:Uncharacterized protein DAT39_001524, partial [Clarias magur]